MPPRLLRFTQFSTQLQLSLHQGLPSAISIPGAEDRLMLRAEAADELATVLLSCSLLVEGAGARAFYSK